jgi:hypothetical protein
VADTRAALDPRGSDADESPRGIGIADATGRLLWADDAFCAVVGRPRDEFLDAGFAEVLSLTPVDVEAAMRGDGLVRIAGDGGAPILRLTPLGPGDGPAAFVLDVGGTTGPEPEMAGPGSVVAALVIDENGYLAGIWGRAADAPDWTCLFTELVHCTARGMAATGLVLIDGIPREARCFPVTPHRGGMSGMIAIVTTPTNRRCVEVDRPLGPQTALARLAR